MLRRLQTWLRVQLAPCPVRLPDRFKIAAIDKSGNCLAKLRTRSTTSALTAQRVWPILFFFTVIRV
ncbi:hypothetical protein EV130_11331 [Rhizobium azibense]|uniref:Uncharacterized protein n=1 Tax=Rhizobium azibense TaxID=1136135 RepID=A0A4R3QF19_9HYPH|nr:hypothetical protein EV130_11331 [Rhizobium azibense]